MPHLQVVQPLQGPLLPGLSCRAEGQGCQKSFLETFLEKEKQDTESLLLAAFILI